MSETAPPRSIGATTRADARPGLAASDRTRVATIVLLLLAVALMVAHALTKIPHVDEGDLASAATSLLDRGNVAFPMSYAYGPLVRDAYFLLPPFYPAAVAGWFTAFGRSLDAYRLFHVAWIVLLVVSWTRLARAGTTSRVVVPITVALLGLNYDIINLGISRYDIVCAALNASAMASYAAWRAERFDRAVLVANCFLALSALTHPFALFGLIGCLALFVAHRDWRVLRVRHVALALAPYAVGFGAWILSMRGQFDALDQQIATQARSRGIDFAHPVRVFTEDFVVRWWQLFAGWREGVPVAMRAKTLFLVLWAIAPVVALRMAGAEVRPLRVAVLAYTLLTILIIPFADNMHVQIYNMHVISALTALTAMAAADIWERWPRRRAPLVAALAGICVFGIGSIGMRVMQRDRQREYAPVHALIASGLGERDFVLGPSEMGFGLGFERRVRDNPHLTSLARGEMPRYIVETSERRNSVPHVVPCEVTAPTPAVHDTTVYLAAPLDTPKDYYRVFVRASPADTIAAAGRPRISIVRDCGPVGGG